MTIDTSTIDGKLAVMQAFKDGAEIEWARRYEAPKIWARCVVAPSWDWEQCDFRIKPREPREFAIAIPLDGRTPHVVPAGGGVYSRHAYAFIKVREVLE